MLMRKSISKLMAVVLSIAIIVSMTPVPVFAAMGGENPPEEIQVQDSGSGTEPGTPGVTDEQPGTDESDEIPPEETQPQDPDSGAGPGTPGVTDEQTGTDEVGENLPEEPAAVKPTVSVGIMPLSDATGLESIINGYGLGGGTGTDTGLTAEVNGSTITVSGDVTGATAPLPLNIDAGVTVVWNADLGFAQSSATRLTLSGSGTFELPEGGKISGNQQSTSAFIIDATGSVTLNITGGTVESTTTEMNTYFAVRIGGSSKLNMTGGSIISSNAGIRVTSNNPDMVIIRGGTIETVMLPIGAKTSTGNITISGATINRKSNANEYNAAIIEPGSGLTFIMGDKVKTGANNTTYVLDNTDADGMAVFWYGTTGKSYTAGNTTDLAYKSRNGNAKAEWFIQSGVSGIRYVGGNHEGFMPITGITVSKKTQISTPTIVGGDIAKTYGDENFTVSATGGQTQCTGAYSYSSTNQAVATIDESSGEVTIVGAGTTKIRAKKLGDDYYYDSINGDAVTLTVSKADQTRPVITDGDINKKYGDANFNLTVTGGNGTGAYSYSSSTPAVATINANGYVTLGTGGSAIGSTTITVRKLGDSNYNASEVSEPITLTVAKGDQTKPVITGGDINMKYGDGSFNLSVTGGNGAGALVYTSSNTAVATINASGAVTLGTGRNAIGSTSITVKKLGDDTYNDSAVSAAITLTVSKANQTRPTISGGNINKKYGDGDFSIASNVSGGESTSAYVYSSSNTAVATINEGGVVTLGTGGSAIGKTNITVKKPGDDTYNDSADSTAVILTVSKADQDQPVIAYTKEGDPSTTGVTVTITSPSSSVAEFSKDNFSTTETGNVIAFPKGTTSATIYARLKASETHNASQSSSVFIDFSKQSKEAPPAFVMTYSYNPGSNNFTVTIPEVAGAEYSFNGLTYSQTRTATANPGGEIEGFIRYSESDTYNASPSVSARLTLPVPVTGITVTGANGKTNIETKEGTLQLSASILPAGATNKGVTWSVADDTGSAIISETGLLKAISDGLVIAKATADDGFGAYGTLTITIGDPNAPAKLELSKKTLTVTGNKDLAVGNNISKALTATVYSIQGNIITPNINWTSNDSNVINIDPNGTIKGLKAGTATISARVAGYPAAYNYCRVTVKENADTSQIFKIETEYKPGYIIPDSAKNNAYYIAGWLTDTKSKSDPTKDAPITLKALKDVGGVETPVAVTWKTSDANVAAIKAVSGDAQVTYKGTGTAVITATTTTGTPKDVVTVTIRVGDTSPKVPVTSLTVYSGSTTGTEFEVLPSDNFEFNIADITKNSLTVLDSKKKASAEAVKFNVSQSRKAGYLNLAAKGAAAGTYYVNVEVTNTAHPDSIASLTDQNVKPVKGVFQLKVSVVNNSPKATLKTAALNTFWNDADGLITITGSNLPEIKGIRAVDSTANKDFKDNFSYEKRGNKFYVIAKPEGDLKIDSQKKPVVKGKVEIEYDGLTVEQDFTVTIKPVAPVLALAPSILTVNKSKASAEATFAVSGLGNEKIKEVNPNSAAGNSVIKGAIRNTDNTFTVAVKDSAKASNALQLDVTLVGARTTIPLKPTVKTVTSDGNFKLSPASLTFSKQKMAATGQRETVALIPAIANAELGAVSIVPDKTNYPEDIAGKEGVPGIVTVSGTALEVKISPETSTGTFKFKVSVAAGADGKGAAGTQTLTVKIENNPLTAAVKPEKGSSINLMDRTGTLMTYVPTIKNSTSPIDRTKGIVFEPASGTTLNDGDTPKLLLSMVDGNIVVKANPAANIKKNETFKGKLTFTLEDGNPVETGVITIKAAQTAVKHNIPKSTTMYQSRTDANHHAVIDLRAITPAGAIIKEDSFEFKVETTKNTSAGKFVNNPNNAYWFSFDEGNQKLHIWIKDSSLVKVGKSTLIFSAIYEGQGWESFKPINSTTAVNEAKPIDIKIPVNVVR